MYAHNATSQLGGAWPPLSHRKAGESHCAKRLPSMRDPRLLALFVAVTLIGVRSLSPSRPVDELRFGQHEKERSTLVSNNDDPPTDISSTSNPLQGVAEFFGHERRTIPPTRLQDGASCPEATLQLLDLTICSSDYVNTPLNAVSFPAARWDLASRPC